MKVLAVRLREVGPFVDGVALENLSGGLDVLAGPNEFGKSTLFRALQTVFFENHATAHKEVERLRPYSGGAPLIEVDFTTAHGRWRIRKQFLADRMATLIDLSSERVAARGKDAEKQLADLIGHGDAKRGDFGRYALLWVAQMAALRETSVEGAAASALHTAIAQEVEAVAGGAGAQRIRERVRLELAELLTPKNARPTGAYAAAKSEHERLVGELQSAEAAEQQAQGRVIRLEALRLQRNELADAASLARLSEACAGARAAYESAKSAAHALQLAAHRLHSQEQAVSAARRLLDDFDRSMREKTALLLAIAESETELGAATQLASQACVQREQLYARAALFRRSDRLGQLTRLRAAVAELATLEAEQRSLERQLHIAAVTPQLLGKIDTEERAIHDLETRLSAAAPSIRFDYEAGRDDGFRVAGRMVAAGAEIRAIEPLVIEITGIGRITVASGSFADRDDMVRDLQAHQQELNEVLANVGAGTVAAARQQAETRRDLQERVRAIGAKRQSLAPQGLLRLKDDLAKLEGELARSGNPEANMPDRLDAEPQATIVDEGELRRSQAGAETALAEVTRLKTMIEQHQHRLVAVTERLPNLEARVTRRGELAKQLEDAEAAANEASRAKTAWAEKTPDAVGLAALETALTEAEAAQEGRVRELHQVELEVRGEEAALAQAGEAGTGLRRLELEGETARSAERVAAFAAEAAMLTQLKQALDAAADELRNHYLKPVEDRLESYLKLVFPGSRLNLGAGFSLAGLARPAADEPFGALSIGTREQLAVLVRLGFGKLFSEAGNPAPVILDDALVYSDDERIGRVFEALRLAAASHQVIVLTCRTAAFAPLGGRRLSLVAWDPLTSAA